LRNGLSSTSFQGANLSIEAGANSFVEWIRKDFLAFIINDETSLRWIQRGTSRGKMLMPICPKLVAARNKTMTKSLPNQEINPLPFVEAYGGDIQRITNIFYGFVASILIGLVAGIFIVLSVNDTRGAALLAIGMLPVATSIYFIRHRQFEISAVFLSVVIIALITLVATRGLGVHHISIMGYPAILIVASLVSRKRIMVFITLFNILCVA